MEKEDILGDEDNRMDEEEWGNAELDARYILPQVHYRSTRLNLKKK